MNHVAFCGRGRESFSGEVFPSGSSLPENDSRPPLRGFRLFDTSIFLSPWH